MTYQIPQQLEYKEKIMFGLNFRQLAYAFVFGLFALLNYKLIPFQYVGIGFALVFCCLGICFIFFDFDIHLRNYYEFIKCRKLKLKRYDFNQFVGISKIKNKHIIDTKNKRIAILKINPINFNIKQTEEKESIILAFQKFLNSIDFPTQFIMNTEGLDLNDYLKSLKLKVNDEQYEKLFESYKRYLENTVKDNKIMNRTFYLVIPEQENIDIQVSVCKERFAALNLKAEQLTNNELSKFLNTFFPKREEEFNHLLKEEFNLPTRKLKYEADYFTREPVVNIDNFPDHLVINNKFFRIIYASGYPRSVEPGFLDRIVGLSGDFNLSMHIKPYPIEDMLVNLNRELQKQRGDMYSMQLKGIINPTLEIQHADTRRTLEVLQKGQERLFNIGLYIAIRADNLEDLNILTKKVEAELNSLMILPKTANFRMIRGIKSVYPVGKDVLQNNRNITTQALSAFFPFTSQFLEADATGVWLGLNKNDIPIIKDIFSLPNPNGVVLAQSGGGKSYFCKLLITRYLLNGTKVIVIDPQGEYKSLVNQFKGQIIDLSRNSKTLINPLDLMGHDYMEKRLSLFDLMPVMLGNLSEPQKAFLDKALTLAYKKKCITANRWNSNPPVMKDLLDALNKLMGKATQLEKSTLRSVINRVDMYVNGVFNFLNKKTNLELKNNLVCFDLGNMPKQIKPVIMFLVLDYVYMKMKSDINRKILLVDEAWSLLSRTEDASYILEIVKTCRKFNMGLLLINQEVEDLFNSRAGKSVLANSAYTLLLRQKPSVINNICDAFHLSQLEREHLLTANKGEGILIMEDDHSMIKVKASPEEDKIITTNPDQLLKLNNEINQTNDNVTVDLDKEFQRKRGLKKAQVEELLEEGFKEFKHKSIAYGKSETFLLHPRHNESLKHMFFVFDIYNFLNKNKVECKMNTTKTADIIFKLNGKKIGLEIETGSVGKSKTRLQRKVESIKKQTYDSWFFIVTDRNLVSKYRKFGETIDPRFIKSHLMKLIKKSQKEACEK